MVNHHKIIKKAHRHLKKAISGKPLLKRRHRQHILKTFLIGLSTLSVGSLAYAITLNKPTIGISVHSSGAGGIVISAPATPTPRTVIQAASGPKAEGPAANTGRASWYALGLPQPDSLTCASRTYARGSYIHVTNLSNGRTVICRVNDYGPEAWTGRIIDLSRGSFTVIDSLSRGVTTVELRPVTGPVGFLQPTEVDVNLMVGYALCATTKSPSYCNEHRQDQ